MVVNSPMPVLFGFIHNLMMLSFLQMISNGNIFSIRHLFSRFITILLKLRTVCLFGVRIEPRDCHVNLDDVENSFTSVGIIS